MRSSSLDGEIFEKKKNTKFLVSRNLGGKKDRRGVLYDIVLFSPSVGWMWSFWCVWRGGIG